MEVCKDGSAIARHLGGVWTGRSAELIARNARSSRCVVASSSFGDSADSSCPPPSPAGFDCAWLEVSSAESITMVIVRAPRGGQLHPKCRHNSRSFSVAPRSGPCSAAPHSWHSGTSGKVLDAQLCQGESARWFCGAISDPQSVHSRCCDGAAVTSSQNYVIRKFVKGIRIRRFKCLHRGVGLGVGVVHAC